MEEKELRDYLDQLQDELTAAVALHEPCRAIALAQEYENVENIYNTLRKNGHFSTILL